MFRKGLKPSPCGSIKHTPPAAQGSARLRNLPVDASSSIWSPACLHIRLIPGTAQDIALPALKGNINFLKNLERGKLPCQSWRKQRRPGAEGRSQQDSE